MAAAFGTRTTVDQSAGVTSQSVTKPPSTGSGEVLVLSVLYDAGATLAGLTGWTLVLTQTVAAAQHASHYTKVTGGAEPASYGPFTTTGGSMYEFAIARFTGVDTGTLQDAAAVGTTPTGTALATNAITTVTDGSIAYCVIGTWTPASAPATLAGGGWTGLATTGSGGDFFLGAWLVKTPAGATGTNATSSQSGTEAVTDITIALRAAATAGLPPGLGPVVSMSQPMQTMDGTAGRY